MWRLRKTKHLVKLLALAPGHRLQREQLMDLLWPDQDPDLAANNLNKAVHIARRALEPHLPAATPSSYLHLQTDSLILRPPGELWVDVEQFERAAAGARSTGEPHAYVEALASYVGDLLPEDRYEDWAARRREELQGLHLGLLLELARLREAHHEPGAAVDLLRQVVASDPLHEEAHAALMRLHAQLGHRHRAVLAYRQLSESLRRELDIEPAPATQQLYQDVLSGRDLPAPYWGRAGVAETTAATASETVGEERGSDLIGRDAELEMLEDMLDDLFVGRGRLVLLEGEAGIGKSRLAAEIAQRVRHRGGTALLGAAYEQEGRLPYGPFVEALGKLHTQIEPDSLQAIFGDALHDLARLTPASASLVRADRQRLFFSVTQLLQDRAAASPVLLVLDDLHAADEASLQLLHYLARTTKDSPIVVLGTLRPEDMPQSSSLGQLVVALQRERLVARLTLQRFGRPEGDLLAASLLDHRPVDRTVLDAIHRLADGNPFFITEVVRDLQERGGLRQVDGRWRLLTEEVPLPGPVVDLLIGRIERLGADAMQVLSLASVAGREVSFSLLRAASDLADPTVLDALDVCLEHQTLEETPDGYRFGHPLQRETIYARLSNARRMSLHGRVAAGLEHLHAGHLADQAETLAHHWARSEHPGRAVPYLIQAGDRAAAVFANESAIATYQRALELLDTPDAPESRLSVEAQLQEKLGDLWMLAGDTARAEEAYQAAVAALNRNSLGEEVWLARLHRKAAYAALTRHDVSAAAVHLEAAEAIVGALTDSVEWGRIRLVRALWLWERGSDAEGRVVAEESLALARRRGEVLDLVNAYMTLALVFHSSGEWKEGLRREIEHVGVAADVDPHLGLVFDAHMCLGEYHLYGDTAFDAVEAYARRTLELTTRVGARRAEAVAWLLLGESLLLRGHWDEAKSCLSRSLDLQHAVGSTAGQALALQRMAELHVYRGNHESAEEHVRQALALEVGPPMAPHVMGRLYATAALNSLENGDPKAAAQILEEAAAAAQRTGDCATCSALIHPVAARTYSALGDLARAEHHAEEAQRVAAYWESEAWRAMAETACASVLQAHGDDTEAFRRYMAAAEAFERMGQRYEAARCFLWAAGIRGVETQGVDARSLVERALLIFRDLGVVTAERQARQQLKQK